MIFIILFFSFIIFIGFIMMLWALIEALTPKSTKEKWKREEEKAKEEQEELLRQKIMKEEMIRQEVRDKLKEKKTIG